MREFRKQSNHSNHFEVNLVSTCFASSKQCILRNNPFIDLYKNESILKDGKWKMQRTKHQIVNGSSNSKVWQSKGTPSKRGTVILTFRRLWLWGYRRVNQRANMPLDTKEARRNPLHHPEDEWGPAGDRCCHLLRNMRWKAQAKLMLSCVKAAIAHLNVPCHDKMSNSSVHHGGLFLSGSHPRIP